MTSYNESHEAAINPQRERTGTIEIPIISNEYGIVCFEDVMMELFRRFEVEKNAKNKCYNFIHRHGHFDAYREFDRQCQSKEIDHNAECVRWLNNILIENEKCS